MTEEILFQITKEHLDTGLRGFPVGHCTTSTVHPEKGLFYVKHPISELAEWIPERVIFLLFYGRDGTDVEIDSFKKEILRRSKVSEEVLSHIRDLPRKGHPMKLFAAAILILGMIEGTGDYQEDCLNLIAKIPELTAAVIKYHAGWKEGEKSKPELGYMHHFSKMLNPPNAKKELPEILTLFNILHYDHGGGNLSTFVGKAVASGLEDMYGSISAAMNALAGPRHGRANQESLQFVSTMVSELGERATEEDVEKRIRDKLAHKELIYGFGHAVLRVEDPRATILYARAEKYYSTNPLVKMALMIRTVGTKVLKENPKISDPYPNVDAISGILLSASDFAYPDYYTVLFGLARCVGISIQIVYERLYAKTPIVRPKYIYKERT